MNINDIVTLTKAGFTKDDIMTIINNEQQPDLQPVQQPDPQPVQQPDPQPQPVQPVQPAPQPNAAIDTRLDYIINRLNLMAVNNSNNGAVQTESTDDILASIINPTYNKKGE